MGWNSWDCWGTTVTEDEMPAWTGADAGKTRLMGVPALELELPAHGVHFCRFTRVRTSMNRRSAEIHRPPPFGVRVNRGRVECSRVEGGTQCLIWEKQPPACLRAMQ
ncbi:hypothetical protein RKD54_004048 [Pseudarthrobacter sp. SLBN-100]|uniref:hypothetical protein n=1 Tax=Arthrobacter sp. SLBN-100 TaxID=2768450 RepID=UPI00190F9D56|nr:hypothetical protein [Arthrobacter sp. SLBN-100]